MPAVPSPSREAPNDVLIALKFLVGVELLINCGVVYGAEEHGWNADLVQLPGWSSLRIVLGDRGIAKQGTHGLLANVHEAEAILVDSAHEFQVLLIPKEVTQLFLLCLEDVIVVIAESEVIKLPSATLEEGDISFHLIEQGVR